MLSTDQLHDDQHCCKKNQIHGNPLSESKHSAICDNDNNENGNTASSGIGIVAFCGIIRYRIAAASRKIILLVNGLLVFVAIENPPLKFILPGCA